MGNCCSSGETKTDNFSSPGRTLGSAPDRSQNATASLPAGRAPGVAKPVGSGGQTANNQQAAPGRTLGGVGSDDGAKAAAARAADERLNKSHGSGTAAGAKLQAQLDAQKKQTDNDIRRQVAAATQRSRDADAAAEARAWN